MKFENNKIRTIVRVLILFLIIIPVVVIIFISPITKYLVEKYDVEYTGREIKIDWAYVNPFTGYVYFSNLKIYESKSDSIFFSAKGVSANFTLYKLLSKTYEISELTLNEPHGIIIQTNKKLNLDDLIEKFTPKKDSTVAKTPVAFSILKIKITSGELYYRETTTPVNVSILKLDIESSGIRWNSDTIGTKYSFVSGTGAGDIRGDLTFNTKNMDFRFDAVIHKFDLNFINQYLKDLTNYGNFRATLDADMRATGNLNDEQDINSHGKMVFSEFHFGKNKSDDYASFEKLAINMDQVYPKNKIYLFDSILLMHPYFKYEAYDYLDNIETTFGKNGSLGAAVNNDPSKFNLVLEIGKYIQRLSENFLASDYHIKRLAITNGDMQYNDYSLNEKFSIAANPLFVTADSIDKDRKRVKFNFTSGVRPYGNVAVVLNIDPKDSSNFNMNYSLQKFPVTMFNPYLITYTSFPLDRGTLEMNGNWNVQRAFIQSTNHLLVIDPRISKRIRKKDSKWIPLPLVMAFVRERGNVIDYEIPITGNLKDPKFHWKDAILDLVENIFVKPPTTPYRLEVRNVENEVEKSLSIKWEMGQCSFHSNQEKFIDKMADFLQENPTASISVYPIEYVEKEKENILFFEAKKKYFLLTYKSSSPLNEKDSIAVDKMNIKDSEFIKYLTKFCSDSMLFTVQQKCCRYVGLEIVNIKFDHLNKKREETFLSYFKRNNTISRVKIYAFENSIPYNGFSNFKITYNGDIPESLIEAYRQMDKMNEEVPRKRYFRERKKDEGIVAYKLEMKNEIGTKR